MKVLKVAEVVKNILLENPKARDNDNLLICFVVKEYGLLNKENGGVYFDWRNQFSTIMSLVDIDKIPSFESITRARRKCQELYEECRGNKWVEEQRRMKEQEYIDFSKNEQIGDE